MLALTASSTPGEPSESVLETARDQLTDAADELGAEMVAAWDEVRTEVEARDITWRKAAYVVALSRVAEAYRVRGLWP